MGASLSTILTTGMGGGILDINAANMQISSLGIERDGFRNGWLAINAGMTGIDPNDPTKTVGWAGIYVTKAGNVDAQVPEPGTLALVGLGAMLLPPLRRRRA
jgi:hypothetical protein